MFKGKYVLLSINELKEKLSCYLGLDFELNDSCDLLFSIQKSNIKTDITNFLAKIVGNNKNLIEDINIEGDCISLNMRECSYMLSEIFDFDNAVAFDEETLIVNDGEYVYLFYIE